MNPELEAALRSTGPCATEAYASPEKPQWAKEIEPHMVNFAVAVSELTSMSAAFYPRFADSPPPNTNLFKARLAVAKEALRIAHDALDGLEEWANRMRL